MKYNSINRVSIYETMLIMNRSMLFGKKKHFLIVKCQLINVHGLADLEKLLYFSQKRNN
jgi:hypothetical protein